MKELDIERGNDRTTVIAICDDDEYIHHKMQQYLTEYAEAHGEKLELVHLHSGVELLEMMQRENCPHFDILYLDIEMPQMNGIDAARYYRRRNQDCKIIMLTSWVERFKEAFVIGAFRFVTKPIQKQELWDSLTDAQNTLLGGTYIDVYRDGDLYHIRQKDIIYIMADRACTKIFSQKFEYRSENTLSWWMEHLDKRLFFRCHKSYIVNLGDICGIGKHNLCVSTGEKVEISRRRYADLLQAYMQYDTRVR